MLGLQSLRIFGLLAVAVLSEPAPGRIPKVYNALITSNQNLEPSKAYPVYQPVIHDAAFAFPYSSVIYGEEFPLNGLGPAPTLKSTDSADVKPATTSLSSTDPGETSSESPQVTSASESSENNDKKPTQTPPLPPNTESPIPLNQFGLPPQLFPLNRLSPALDGFTQLGPFTYPYPGFRLYEPYEPFALNPYANLYPVYRQLTHADPQHPARPVAPSILSDSQMPNSEQSPNQSSVPPEPTDLNILNYSPKDPAIPNVVPTPLTSRRD